MSKRYWTAEDEKAKRGHPNLLFVLAKLDADYWHACGQRENTHCWLMSDGLKNMKLL